ncbi:MAG TPA: hypothetical protein VE439_09615 [Anaerolineae bacterium]|nr:hypothetical protein [Anaerolineae bacterium]
MDEEILKYGATKSDLENLVSKDEFRQSQDKILSRIDEVVTIVQRIDQRCDFTFECVKRLEAEVEKNRKDIDHIKDILRIS